MYVCMYVCIHVSMYVTYMHTCISMRALRCPHTPGPHAVEWGGGHVRARVANTDGAPFLAFV